MLQSQQRRIFEWNKCVVLEDIEWNIHWIFFYCMPLVSLFIIEVVNKQFLKLIQKVSLAAWLSAHAILYVLQQPFATLAWFHLKHFLEWLFLFAELRHQL